MKDAFLVGIIFLVMSVGTSLRAQTIKTLPPDPPVVVQPPDQKNHSEAKSVEPPPGESEVEAAFAAYPLIADFERLPKYSGLSAKDFAFYQNHYAPPIQGVVIETDPALTKRLAQIGKTVFRLHRVEKQCAVVLLRSRLPTVFTWKLSFVSLTTRDLELFTDEELTALIAHEIGHLYFADDLQRARETKDDRLARVTELKCDLLAFETLRRLKIDPAVLVGAVEKLLEARARLNIVSASKDSPTVEDRRHLAVRYTERSVKHRRPNQSVPKPKRKRSNLFRTAIDFSIGRLGELRWSSVGKSQKGLLTETSLTIYLVDLGGKPRVGVLVTSVRVRLIIPGVT